MYIISINVSNDLPNSLHFLTYLFINLLRNNWHHKSLKNLWMKVWTLTYISLTKKLTIPLPAPDNHHCILCFYKTDSLKLDYSYKWFCTVFVLLCLDYFIYYYVLRFIYVVNENYFLFFFLAFLMFCLIFIF